LTDGTFFFKKGTDTYNGCCDPPSFELNVHHYYDPTPDATSIGISCLAVGARVLAQFAPQAAFVAKLKAAALKGWTAAHANPPAASDSAFNTYLGAAALVFRLDSTQTTARSVIDAYNWGSAYLQPATLNTLAAYEYLMTPSATASTTSSIKSSWVSMVNSLVSGAGYYRNEGFSWSYYWGSNAFRGLQGLMLIETAVELSGVTTPYSKTQLLEAAQEILHYFHGQNPLQVKRLCTHVQAAAVT
jgi:hypothetical protein